MGDTPAFRRALWYRDEHGRQRLVLVESTDPAELDRVERFYRRLERRSRREDESWRARHGTFADLPEEVDPDSVAEAAGAKSHNGGLPWEGPRFAFAYLLGEGAVWSGQASLWLYSADGSLACCRLCGHLRELPPSAACLNGECNRTGRDLAIPRVTSYDRKRREEPKKEEKPKTPPPLRDRTGKVLAGGLGGKR